MLPPIVVVAVSRWGNFRLGPSLTGACSSTMALRASGNPRHWTRHGVQKQRQVERLIALLSVWDALYARRCRSGYGKSRSEPLRSGTGSYWRRDPGRAQPPRPKCPQRGTARCLQQLTSVAIKDLAKRLTVPAVLRCLAGRRLRQPSNKPWSTAARSAENRCLRREAPRKDTVALRLVAGSTSGRALRRTVRSTEDQSAVRAPGYRCLSRNGCGFAVHGTAMALSLCIPFLTLEERVTQLALVSTQLYAAALEHPFENNVDFCSPPVERLMLQPVFLRHVLGRLVRTLRGARFGCVEHLPLLGALGSPLVSLTLENIPNMGGCTLFPFQSSPVVGCSSDIVAESLLPLDPLIRWLLYLAQRCPRLETLTLRFNGTFPFTCGLGSPKILDVSRVSHVTVPEHWPKPPAATLTFQSLRHLTLLGVVSTLPLNLMLCAKFPSLKSLTLSTTSIFPTASLADFLQQCSRLWFSSSKTSSSEFLSFDPSSQRPQIATVVSAVPGPPTENEGLEVLSLYHGSNVANQALLDAVERQQCLTTLRLVSPTSFGSDVVFSHGSVAELYLQYDLGLNWSLRCDRLRRLIFVCRGESAICRDGICATKRQLDGNFVAWLTRNLPHLPALNEVLVECSRAAQLISAFTVIKSSRESSCAAT